VRRIEQLDDLVSLALGQDRQRQRCCLGRAFQRFHQGLHCRMQITRHPMRIDAPVRLRRQRKPLTESSTDIVIG